ncbi:MAG: deoxyribonuclease IV [Erysipelotrichaceae bacterium]
MKLGSHVSMSGPDYLVGSIKEAQSYGANAMMIYTGAPQNTVRKKIEDLKLEEAKALMQSTGFDANNVVVHAPYIINLANTTKPETFELAVSFLKLEIARVQALGFDKLVLHPGAHLKVGVETGLARIVEGLNLAMVDIGNVMICLETMAGKGSEIGRTFEELKYIKDHAKFGANIKFCLDTCHVHDAGYDLSDVDGLLAEFDQILGLEHLLVLHINDSKNIQGAAKDRHANLGDGEIGFSALHTIVNHPLLADKIKILETPYIDGVAPYKEEIERLLAK